MKKIILILFTLILMQSVTAATPCCLKYYTNSLLTCNTNDDCKSYPQEISGCEIGGSEKCTFEKPGCKSLSENPQVKRCVYSANIMYGQQRVCTQDDVNEKKCQETNTPPNFKSITPLSLNLKSYNIVYKGTSEGFKLETSDKETAVNELVSSFKAKYGNEGVISEGSGDGSKLTWTPNPPINKELPVGVELTPCISDKGCNGKDSKTTCTKPISATVCQIGDFELISQGSVGGTVESSVAPGSIEVNIKRAAVKIDKNGQCSPRLSIVAKFKGVNNIIFSKMKDNKKIFEKYNVVLSNEQFDLMDYINNELINKYKLTQSFRDTDMQIYFITNPSVEDSNKIRLRIMTSGKKYPSEYSANLLAKTTLIDPLTKNIIVEQDEIFRVIQQFTADDSDESGSKSYLDMPPPTEEKDIKGWKYDSIKNFGAMSQYWRDKVKIAESKYWDENRNIGKVHIDQWAFYLKTKDNGFENSVGFTKIENPDYLYVKAAPQAFKTYYASGKEINLELTKDKRSFTMNSAIKVSGVNVKANTVIKTNVDIPQLNDPDKIGILKCCPKLKAKIDDFIKTRKIKTNSNSIYLIRETNNYDYKGEAYQFSPEYAFNADTEISFSGNFVNPIYEKYNSKLLNQCQYDVIDSVSKTIGPSGGEIYIEGIKQVIPEKAVSQDTTFTIKKINLNNCHCLNDVKDSDETGLDCGGSCPACEQLE